MSKQTIALAFLCIVAFTSPALGSGAGLVEPVAKEYSDSNITLPDKGPISKLIAPPTHATFWGTIRNDEGSKVCGLVLANGQQMFTCDPLGEYGLTVPLDKNLEVKLMSFADGQTASFTYVGRGLTIEDKRELVFVCGVAPAGVQLGVTVDGHVRSLSKQELEGALSRAERR